MKHLIFIFLLFPLLLSSQDQSMIDSLKTVLEKSDNDSIKTMLLINIGNQYIKWDYEEANQNFKKALSFALKSNSKTLQAQSLISIGIIHRKQGKYNIALQFFEKALKIREEIGDKKKVAITLLHIAILHSSQGKREKAMKYQQQALEVRKDNNDKPGIAHSLYSIAGDYLYQDEFDMAMDYYNQSLKIYEKLGSNKWIAKCLSSLGNIYKAKGDYVVALEYFQKSLKVYKNQNSSLSNIGLIYKEMGDDKKALEYLKKGLKFTELKQHKYGIALNLNHIGLIYIENGEYSKAKVTLLRALEVSEMVENKSMLARSLQNIGLIYDKQGEYDKALDNYKKSMNVRKRIYYKAGIAESLIKMSNIYFKQGKHEKAIIAAEKALELSKKLGIAELIENASQLLYIIYKKSGQASKALLMLEVCNEIKENSNKEQINNILQKNEFEIKMALKEKEIENQELQTRYGYALGGLIILILLSVSLLMYRNYIIKTRSNQKLESVNIKLDEKNKNIMSNINYAKKIQEAILPSKETIKKVIPDSFTFYLPKDVVSGDFYWVYKDKNNNAYFAAVDCTGHGVSGAFMSIIGQAILNELIVNQNITEVDDILFNMKEYIIQYLHQTGEAGETRDGMDMALCKMKNDKLYFAGAFNPLVIIRNNEIIETKGDAQPVGYYIGKNTPFTKHEIKVEKGDMIYLFSDGYADQFGGPKGKKYMAEKFKQLLLNISKLSCEEQYKELEKEHSLWKGDYDQIDDICIIGVRV